MVRGPVELSSRAGIGQGPRKARDGRQHEFTKTRFHQPVFYPAPGRVHGGLRRRHANFRGRGCTRHRRGNRNPIVGLEARWRPMCRPGRRVGRPRWTWAVRIRVLRLDRWSHRFADRCHLADFVPQQSMRGRILRQVLAGRNHCATSHRAASISPQLSVRQMPGANIPSAPIIHIMSSNENLSLT